MRDNSLSCLSVCHRPERTFAGMGDFLIEYVETKIYQHKKYTVKEIKKQ